MGFNKLRIRTIPHVHAHFYVVCCSLYTLTTFPGKVILSEGARNTYTNIVQLQQLYMVVLTAYVTAGTCIHLYCLLLQHTVQVSLY